MNNLWGRMARIVRWTLVGLLCWPFGLAAQFADLAFFEGPPRSPFNGSFVDLPAEGWSYSFMTGGHLYGAHANKKSLYPAASFLGNLSRINGKRPDLFVATGDILRTSRDSLMRITLKRVLKDLDAPFYNAPGNHDLIDFKAYERDFGEPQMSFYLRDDLFLILNTEPLLSNGPEFVYGYVEEQKAKAEKRSRPVRNVFVFSHRMPWTESVEELAWMDGLVNAAIHGKVPVEDAQRVVDGVAAIPHEGETWWFAGDVGTHWSVPACYGYWPEKDMHFAAAGLGDHENDALLRVTVAPDGKVSAEPFGLNGQAFPDLEQLGEDYWKKEEPAAEASTPEPQVNRWLTVWSKKSFWFGVGLGAVAMFLLSLLLRRFGR